MGKEQEYKAGGPKLKQEEDKQHWFQPIPDWCLPNWGKSKANGGADISENVLAQQSQDKTQCIIRGIWSPWFTKCDDINKRDLVILLNQINTVPSNKVPTQGRCVYPGKNDLTMHLKDYLSFSSFSVLLALRCPKFKSSEFKIACFWTKTG